MNEHYKIYTSKQEADKVNHTFKGMLEGVIIDKELNHSELDEVSKWYAKNAEYFHGDFYNNTPRFFLGEIRVKT